MAEEIVKPGIESVVRFHHFDQTKIRDEAELKPVLPQSSSRLIALSIAGVRYTLVQARSTGLVGRKRINLADATWKRKCASAPSRWKKSDNRVWDAVSCAAFADHAASHGARTKGCGTHLSVMRTLTTSSAQAAVPFPQRWRGWRYSILTQVSCAGF